MEKVYAVKLEQAFVVYVVGSPAFMLSLMRANNQLVTRVSNNGIKPTRMFIIRDRGGRRGGGRWW